MSASSISLKIGKPMQHSWNNQELAAYLDEALPAEGMMEVEKAIRADPAIGQRLAAINRRRDAGVQSLGEVWRRGRISCATRDELGSFLLRALPDALEDHIRFHLEVIECRYCQANLDDLRQQAEQLTESTQNRRSRYFQSSAGYLKKD